MILWRRLRLALFVLALASTPSLAQVTCPGGASTWNGSVSTLWNDASNWTPAAVPGVGADVCFAAGNPTVSLNVAASLNTFNVLGGSTLTLTGSAFRNLTLAAGIQADGSFTFNSIPQVIPSGTQSWILNGTSTFNSPLAVPAAVAATTTISVSGAGDLTLNAIAPRGFQGFNWGSSGILTLTTNGLGAATPITLTPTGFALLISSSSALNLDNPVTATTTGQFLGVDGTSGITHTLGRLTISAGQTLEELPAGANPVKLQVAGLTLGAGSTLLKQSFGGLSVNGSVSDTTSSTLNLLIGLLTPTGTQLDEGLHFLTSTTVSSIISSTAAGSSAMVGADGATTLTLSGAVSLGSAGRLILIPRSGASILFGPSSFSAPGNPNDIQLRGTAGNTVEFTNGAVTANAVTVYDGLAFQTDASAPPTVTFSTTGGATWRIRNAAQTLTGSLSLNAAGTVDTGTDLTISGVLAGSGALTKNGAGSLILGPGVDTHNGGIAVNAGTLEADGTLTGENTISIANGGGLAGSGTLQSITGPITVAGGGRYTPGSGGAGNLTTNDLSLSDTSSLTFTVGTATTQGIVNGALILDGILTINQGAGFAQGTYTLFTATGAITNNSLRSGTLPPGFSYDYQVAGNTVVLKVGPAATAAEMVTLDAVSDGAVARVTWEAGTEIRNLGYRVYREENGKRREVSGLIAGSALRAGFDPLAGRNYAFTDRAGRYGGRYWVEAIDLNARSQWFGPIDVRRGAVASSGLQSAALVAHLGTGPLLTAPAGSNARQVDPPGFERSWNAQSLERQWDVAASSGAVKLLVRRDGVYRVNADQLFAAGLPGGTPLSSIQLWAGGRLVAFRAVTANGSSLQPGDAIEFFGQAADTRYTDTRVYWVTAGLGRPTAMQAAPPTGVTFTTTSFLETLEIRDRTLHISGLKNIDTDGFFGPPIIGTTPMLRVFSTPALAMLAPDPPMLEVSVQGLTNGSHTLDVTVNGLAVGTIQSVFQDVATARFTLPPGALVPGDNKVALVGRTGTEIAVEISQKLTYPRQYTAASALRFTAPSGSDLLLVGGDASTHVLDITRAYAPAVVATSATSGGVRLTASGSGTRVLYAYRDQDVLIPTVVANNPSRWHDSTGGNLVIIGQRDLLPSLRPLAEQRAREGLAVAVIDIEDVYDEFSAGMKDAFAIRSFLSTAVQRWSTAPQYVLLAGAATYDPRGWLGQPQLDQVPTVLVQTRYMETASDDALVTFDATGPALAIGRLPMPTPAEMDAAVAKILGRRLAGAQDSLLLARDRDGTSPFSAASAEVRNALSGWNVQEFARGPDDTANHSALLDAMRAGPIAVDYQGHGAEDFWNGRILSTADADALAGTGSTSLMVAATCLNAYFVDIGRESLGAAMLRAPNGGAWGVFASSALTLPTEHALLSKTLLSAVLNNGLTLGEATLKAKQAVTDPDVRATFHLLGDPSARAVATRSAALTVGSPKSGASGCSTPGGPVSALAPLVLVVLALSLRRRRPS